MTRSMFDELKTIATTAAKAERRGDDDGTDVAMSVRSLLLRVKSKGGHVDRSSCEAFNRVAVVAVETERRGEEDGTELFAAMRDASIAQGGLLAT